MIGGLQAQDSGSAYLNRYSQVMASLARQRKAEAALMDTRDRAEVIATRLNQVIEQTASESDYLVDMSYKLRTLLNAIMGFSSLMENESQGPLQESYKAYAADIHSSGMEVLGLIESFDARQAGVADSPAEAPEAPVEEPVAEAAPAQLVGDLQETHFSLTDIIREAYADIREMAAEREVKIRARLSRDLPQIRADRELLRSMFTHLLGVAVDGTLAGAEVELIGSTDEEGSLRFAIDTTVHNVSAIAKGLARPHWDWVSEIMQKHGGTFALEGDPKRHFLAVVTLPAVRTDTAARKPAPAAETPA